MSATEKGSLAWQGIDYDYFLTKLGEFGWFQKKALFWLWFPAFVGGIVSLFHPSDIFRHFVLSGGGDVSLLSARAFL